MEHGRVWSHSIGLGTASGKYEEGATTNNK